MKKIVHILEIIIWIVILFACMSFITDHYMSIKYEKRLVEVEFDDIDGLEIGAPVHFMGVVIGSVKEFKIINGKVQVTFSIKDPDLVIPKGSTATIQFTGLVGSKTLEIEVPKDRKKTKKDLIAINPIRISSFIEISAKNSESIASGSKNFLKLFGEGTMLRVKQNIFNFNERTQGVVEGTDTVYHVVKKAKNTFLGAVQKINNSLGNYVVTTDRILVSMNARDYDEETKAILRAMKLTLYYFYQNLKESNYNRFLEDIIYSGHSLNRRIDKKSIEFFVNLDMNKICKKIEKVNSKIKIADKVITKVQNTVENIKFTEFLESILGKATNIEEKTRALEEAL